MGISETHKNLDQATIFNLNSTRSDRGKRAFLDGEAAEQQVQEIYEQRGMKLAAKRWRGGGGEIDLVFKDGALCVFVEVKKSRSWDRAASALRPRQIARLMQAATVFVADEPKGQLTDMRFDVALVDQHGLIEILENALIA